MKKITGTRFYINRPLSHLSALLFAMLVAGVVQAQEERVFDPARWDDAMARFAQQDIAQPPKLGAIVLTGSSSIARWNQQSHAALAPLSIIARGFGGSVMEDVVNLLDTVALQYRPRAILIYEGDNDTFFKVPEDKIVAQFEQIVARIHRQLPETRIYAMSVKPSLARVSVWPQAQNVNRQLEAIAAADDKVYYVDAATPFLTADGSVMDDIFVADGLHLNDKGNEIWGRTIRAALMAVEAQYE